MPKRKTDQVKLERWQKRLADNKSAYSGQLAKVDRREALYSGTHDIESPGGGKGKNALHVRNVVAEIVESLVDSNIPMPKVTARREQDEPLAKVIEDMIRNELDRMDFEGMNDMQERTVPIQGGSLFLVEWDNETSTHATVGELAVSHIHPKQFVPQDGVYSSVEDMAYCIVAAAQTKSYVKNRYGVDVDDETESEPGAEGLGRKLHRRGHGDALYGLRAEQPRGR